MPEQNGRGPAGGPVLHTLDNSAPQQAEPTAYLEADEARCWDVAMLFVDRVAEADPARTQDELDDLAHHLVARLMTRRCS